MATGTSPEIALKRVPYSETVARHIDLAPKSDPLFNDDYYKEAVEQGKAVAYGVFVDGEHLCSVICSIHETSEGAEWLGEVAGSESGKEDLTAVALGGFEYLAKQAGCKVIRFNTVRGGLVKKAQNIGYQISEFVLRKVLEDVEE